ncbi:membrane associated rhomboid family serine protease [Wenyingzhuangia heitensis]|uniref:Membrane associated rhomboid family serine protease n=1 Tax=Wenyingzhuangia heitensis TaxID=1487859 RepID=A0ABX0U9A2_9FLAO|nr:rhomboid family intramembrane serine protease [Wenyingzhuangia heitensis]NIJ44793.1 membrane associated rhomboid family serine protease [Wenyingzhuangia heitensis]
MKFISIALIVANVLFSIQGFKDLVFFNKYKFSVLAVQRGEKYRLFSSGFLHADYMHLGFNMFALYLFSETVLNYFSPLQYLIIYGLSLLAGNYLSLLIHKSESYYTAVGASGAVTGIVYASIVLFPDMSLYIFPLPIAIKGYVFGIGYLFYSIYGMKNQVGNIGHTAHLGGAVAGYVLSIVFMPSVLQVHSLQTLLLAVPIVVLIVLQKKNLFQ